MKEATFVSVWDDGAVSVESKCSVSLDGMVVIKIEAPHVLWLKEGGVYEDDLIDQFIDDVSHLDEEYIQFSDGKRFTAARADMASSADDLYGNGIVAY